MSSIEKNPSQEQPGLANLTAAAVASPHLTPLHVPAAAAAAAAAPKRSGGRPRNSINVHFDFHSKKNLSCRYCDSFSHKNTRGLPDRFDHLASCTDFMIQQPEEHAAVVAESIRRNTSVDIETHQVGTTVSWWWV